MQGTYDVALQSPSLSEVLAAVKAMENKMAGEEPEFPLQPILVQFSEPTPVVVNRRWKKVDQMQCYFLFTKKHGVLYSRRGSSGYPLSHIECSNITSLSIRQLNAGMVRWNKIMAILRLRHPNAWNDLQSPAEVSYQQASAVSIGKRFPNWVYEQLKFAFDNMSDFEYCRPGEGRGARDLRVGTKLCDDGVFRAWYSSVQQGGGKERHYLLLNPTTAAFREDD